MNDTSEFLTPYYQRQGQHLQVEAEQASAFAKRIATDFNPIHDADAKRFCVPGDLLFALVVSQYGLSPQMAFRFDGMVGKGVNLVFPEDIGDEFTLQDDKEKSYLSLTRGGESVSDGAQIEQFIRTYVAFSGHNFVDILVPLMRDKQVMINPARPLVIYERMAFDLTRTAFDDVQLALSSSRLDVDGKRGDVTLEFVISDSQGQLGTGVKTLILSGLRDYDEAGMESMLDRYNTSKAHHEAVLAEDH
ncbi:Uncharacterised protein [BD1-7 clade bacterium]|uniref:DUF3581 domain-containing protein n=1 Tax=BD1-7 clade bacterium TaxID=2029982 RepID=A0A5S9PNR2_9GAMM|nr:Uncharacterised protein [BD1-7 clade bacterium]